MTETHIHPEYVTSDELAELVLLLDHRFARFERWLWLLSTVTIVILMVLIYVASRVS